VNDVCASNSVSPESDIVNLAVSLGGFEHGSTQSALFLNVLRLRAKAPAIEQQRVAAYDLYQRIMQDEGQCLPDVEMSPPSTWVALSLAESCKFIIFTDASSITVNDLVMEKDCDIAPVQIWEWDHVYGLDGPTEVIAVLHGVLGTDAFSLMNKKLKDIADSAPGFKYLIRYMPMSKGDPLVTDTSLLQGFGISLDIKNMEYITVDDNKKEHQEVKENSKKPVDLKSPIGGLVFETIISKFPVRAEALKALHAEITEEHEINMQESNEIVQIPVWELGDISLQATARILSSTDPLAWWTDLTQNFPIRARNILKTKLSSQLRKQADFAKQLEMDTGSIRINGIRIDVSSESFNIFSVLKIIDDELENTKLIQDAGIDCTHLRYLSEIFGEGVDEDDQAVHILRDAGMRLDIKQQAKGSIFFLNNIEKDKKYDRWPLSFQYLLQRSAQLIPVRKNIYNIILVLDFRDALCRTALQDAINYLESGAPVRIGIVFTDNPTYEADPDICDSSCWTNLFLLAMKQKNRKHAINFLSLVADSGRAVSLVEAKEFFARAISEKSSGSKYDEMLQLAGTEDSNLKSTTYAMAAYVSNLGLMSGYWTLNGLVQTNLENFGGVSRGLLFQEQRILQFQVHFGKLTDEDEVLGFLLRESNRMTRFHPDIFKSVQDSTYAVVPLNEQLLGIKYLYHVADEPVITMWLLVDDFANPFALKAAAQFLLFLRLEPSHVRAVILPSSRFQKCSNIWKAIEDDGLKSLEYLESVSVCEEQLVDTNAIEFPKAMLGFKLYCNGRVFNADSWTSQDFVSLLELELEMRFEGAKEFIDRHPVEHPDVSDALLSTAGIAGVLAATERNWDDLDNPPLKELRLSVPSTLTRPQLFVSASVDPVSETSQRASTVLKFLHEELGAGLELLFLPNPSVSVFPISSFFRFVAGSESLAVFSRIPQKQLLTLKISTPEPWIVYPSNTHNLDTDNILLERESDDAQVEFELKSLLVTGHCNDIDTGSAPAGLQLLLSSKTLKKIEVGTIVMKNLGYLQMQANPGVWGLSLSPGISQDIYDIEQIGDEKLVLIRDFAGVAASIRVKKKRGFENVDLLESLQKEGDSKKSVEEKDTGLVNKLYSMTFGNSPPQEAPPAELETIHVFSLASGALYERFMRIMCVSVVKATRNPVKFWFIENFLSPEFKISMPILAKKFNFEYSLVTYKWPHWLRRQTEKQRIIWGYKILFLDVLFPLDIPKIIYVDSDQVVRADLKELWDMDLEGCAYGYTPFCDSRKETLGFQFWRSGYWKDHLRGRPYHISALYVVDLVKFRQMMVGDQLRAIYDQLSRDPNSLSNLDQDLPNFAQNQVPIFSLPQEWLWCESWCSDKSKAEAKTIDLCNNPLHKEPKLDMAKRVISGKYFPQSWIELDDEIKTIIQYN